MKSSSVCISLVGLFISLACAAKPVKDSYPDVWWEPFPPNQKESWEILPQEADRSKGEVILSKRNELGLLSNFTPAPFTLDGETYASLEGFWQAMKFPENDKDERMKNPKIKWPFTRKQVMQMSSFEASRAGKQAGENMKTLGIKWITYRGQKIEYKGADQQKHYDLIYRATVAKVQQNKNVKELLKRTGDLKLLPDHHQDPDATPAYRYYDILMKIRGTI